MVNHWTDLRLKRDLLEKIRATGGYGRSKAIPWGYWKTLTDGKGKVIFEAIDPSRGHIINEVVDHFEKGTNI